MIYAIPKTFEAALQQLAQQEGLTVNEVIEHALARLVGQVQAGNGANGGGAAHRSLKGTVLKYDDPHKPALPASDWEAMS